MQKKLIILSLIFLLSIVLISAENNISNNLSYSQTTNYSLMIKCQEKWSCNTWSNCYYGERERNCYDENHCGTIENKPSERRLCYSNLNNNYQYYKIKFFCNDQGYYSMHSCLDYYYSNNLQSDYINMMNYYNQNKPVENTQNEQPIQIINIQYPIDDKTKNDSYYNDFWIIGAITIGILIVITLIIIIAIALSKR
jgi:hypothetical protein